jgi:outer membrane lipoprotein-sorting protein
MRRYFIIKGISLFLIISSGLRAGDETAREVVKKADERMRGKTSRGEMTIQTVRPTWTRELKLKTWSKGTNQAMILITAPAKENGTVFLRKEKEVWNWVPSIERIIKLPPSMMTQSWMGTDFSNDDLVKESSVVDDYTHSFAGDSVIQGRLCYKIRMIPKHEAAVVWGMVMVWIDKKDYLQMRAAYYDEENELVNTLQGYDVKILGNRLLPTRFEMIPADKPGNKTVMYYASLVFDEPLTDDFFTIQHMKKLK